MPLVILMLWRSGRRILACRAPREVAFGRGADGYAAARLRGRRRAAAGGQRFVAARQAELVRSASHRQAQLRRADPDADSAQATAEEIEPHRTHAAFDPAARRAQVVAETGVH